MTNELNVPFAVRADTSISSDLTNIDAQKRLEQAAHILVSAAYRVARKEKAATLLKPTSKTTILAPEQMSDIQTSPGFCLEGREKAASKSAKKPSKKTRSPKATGQNSGRSKDLWREGELVGMKS